MATISPTPKLQFLDANGAPLSYGLLYTYVAGTTTPKTTWIDAAQSTPNTNPVLLDSRGQADVWLNAGEAYKFVVLNSSSVTQYTVDNITGAGTMSVQNANNVTITGGSISGVSISGPISGELSGNVTGNVTGDVTGSISGGTISGSSYNSGQLAGLRNKIINGNMMVAQRGTSFTTATSPFTTLDRWRQFRNTAASFTVSQASDAPATAYDLVNSLRVTVVTADTSVASGEYVSIYQSIEGYDARSLVNRDLVISFWVRSAKTGTHCVALVNSGGDRSFIFEYTVNAINTWEFKTLTLPNGLITAGTWDWANGVGVRVYFSLMMGSTRQSSAGSWLTGGVYLSTVDQVNVMDTVGNVFAITGVRMEPGLVVTPFEHRSIGLEMTLCQRYYEKSFPYATAPAQNVGSTLGAAYATGQVLNQAFSTLVTFAAPKRAAPTITTYAPDAATANWSTNGTTPTASTTNIGDSGFALIGSTAVTAGNGYSIHWAADAEM